MGYRSTVFTVIVFGSCLRVCQSTYRYYNNYITYGTGDTIVQTYHYHGGSTEPMRKWNIECMDGEAAVGVNDWWEDFARLQIVWCKFMFPLKPPTEGAYPYYPSCHTRNLTDQWLCYNPQNTSATANTFITGFYGSIYFLFLFRIPGPDAIQPYKCCKTPAGYYIDYVSCYYMPTHDIDFEYYDSTFQILVFCATGYVMTGVSKKVNPYSKEWHIDWIQCCRVGYGKPYNANPPVIYSDSGAASYYSPTASVPNSVNPTYSGQYRSLSSDGDDLNVVDVGAANRTGPDYFDRNPSREEENMMDRPELFAAIEPTLRSRNQAPIRPHLLNDRNNNQPYM